MPGVKRSYFWQRLAPQSPQATSVSSCRSCVKTTRQRGAMILSKSKNWKGKSASFSHERTNLSSLSLRIRTRALFPDFPARNSSGALSPGHRGSFCLSPDRQFRVDHLGRLLNLPSFSLSLSARLCRKFLGHLSLDPRGGQQRMGGVSLGRESVSAPRALHCVCIGRR